MNLKSDWKNAEWSKYLYDNIPESMLKAKLSDGDLYYKGYNELSDAHKREFFVMLFSSLARFESGFKPETTYKEGFNDSKGKPVISTGLFQVSVESLAGYKFITTQEALKYPYTNIDAMLVIANRWLVKDGCVAGGKTGAWKSLSRYWSPFRKAHRIAAIRKNTNALTFKGEVMSGYKRELNKVMIEYFDSKLKNNPAYIDAVNRRDARMIFGLSMEACVGIQEATGKNDGKMVEAIQDTVGSASGEPWCMALIQTCIANAERVTEITSPIHVSELCYDVWHKTKKSQRVKVHPLYAAIAIWNDVGTTRGHTEMVKSADNKVFQAIGGNTSGTDKEVKREGNACVYTVRPMKTTGKRQLLGFLKPF